VIGNVLKSIRNGVYATPNVDPGRGAYFWAIACNLILYSKLYNFTTMY
jgi:hypothetical protein